MKSGSWAKISNMDFGAGANSFTARVAASGNANIQIILDNLNNPPVGTLFV